MEKSAIIIGAGITGLSLAFRLKKAGITPVVIEKEGRTGGVINTVNKDGFIFETGPNTGVVGNSDIVQLFEDMSGKIEVEHSDAISGHRLIFKNERWMPLPSGLISGISTPLFTLRDKLKLLGEPFRKKGNDPDETLASLVIRRMGRSFLDYAVDPFVSGVYAGDANRLVTRYAFPKLYNLEQEYGSFIKGAVVKGFKGKTEAEKKVTRRIFSIKGGLNKLTEALSEATGYENIRLECRNVRIEPAGKLWRCSFERGDKTESIFAGYVVSTVTPDNYPQIFPFIDKDLLSRAMDIDYAGVVEVAVGYHKWEGMPLTAFGGLYPSTEKRNVLGILFPSAMFSSRAPADGALLSVFLGGVRNPGMILKSDEELKTLVLDEVGNTLDCSLVPDIMQIFRYRYAIPQYGINTGNRLKALDLIEKRYNGLFHAGNVRDGVGLADRVKQGYQLAERIISHKGI